MSAPPTPAAKTERLLNLVIALLSTRRPLSKAEVRSAVQQYRQTASVEAFDRMFERDKDELRALGVPLRTEVLDAFFDDETGYRIDKDDYQLPEITFAPDELAALGLAARSWHRASLAGDASQALRKLRAAGVDVDDEAFAGIEPRVGVREPAFDAVRRAVLSQTPVAFDYRKTDGATTARTVRPWGLASWHGRWYLSGFDVDRGEERVFRLGRVAGAVRTAGRPGSYAVPAGHSARGAVRRATERTGASGPGTPATIRLRSGAGHLLRRRGAERATDGAGWDTVELPAADVDDLAAQLCALGADAVAVGPPELVRAVVDRLTALRDAS